MIVKDFKNISKCPCTPAEPVEQYPKPNCEWWISENTLAILSPQLLQSFPLTAGALLGPAFNRLEVFQVG